MGNMNPTDAAIDTGAECQPILAGFQLTGGLFVLTFPFIEYFKGIWPSRLLPILL
jgi:hypothetical protein